jgi:Ran GTPase-activating protein (RanGAP) involved in mRNA processing and transport
MYTPSRPTTAASTASNRTRTTTEDIATLLFRQKTRRAKTFLKDNDAAEELLPQPLPPGIPYVANFTSFDELLQRNILQQTTDEQVHLGTDDVRLMYEAKCIDQNLKPTWEREVRFMELLSANCKGTFFCLTETGLGKTCAEAVAHILSVNDFYSILDLSGNRLRDDGAESIAKLLRVNESVVHLGLRSNDIGHRGGQAIAMALCSNNSITSLDLGGHGGINRNHIGTEGAAALGDALRVNAVLCSLSVSSNGLGSEGMTKIGIGLQGNKTLARLNIASNNLGYEGAKVLASILESTELRELDLSRNSIGDRGGQLLFQALARGVESGMETLQKLNLEHNDLGEGTAKKAVALISGSRELQVLRLCGNDFGGGIKDLADAIGDSRELREVTLSDCLIKGPHGAFFATTVANTRRLERLDLSKNRLSDEGVSAIAETLRHNKTLLKLDLGSNMITDVGGLALARVLRDNKTLQDLDVRHNQMTTVSGDAMDDELRRNTTLQKMDVTFNDFTYKCFSGIQQTLQRNLAAWTAEVVPRLHSDIAALAEKNQDLVKYQEEIDVERRLCKEHSEQLLRRKEEVRVIAEKFRNDLSELDGVVSETRRRCETAEEAHRFAEEKVNTESTQLAGKRNGIDNKTQGERDKRERIVRDIEKLRKQLKSSTDVEAEMLRPLQAELTRVEQERNSDKSDAKHQGELLANLNIKKKQLEISLGISTAGVTPAPVKAPPAKGKK